MPELKGLIDVISVSLNGANALEYDELSQPNFKGAYDEVKKFIKTCADVEIETVATVVEGYKGRHLDLKKCEKILFVTANPLKRLIRAKKRDGLPLKQILARFKNQKKLLAEYKDFASKHNIPIETIKN